MFKRDREGVNWRLLLLKLSEGTFSQSLTCLHAPVFRRLDQERPGVQVAARAVRAARADTRQPLPARRLQARGVRQRLL